MRVLLVCETLEAGGAERQVTTDAAVLAEGGVSVAVVSWSGGSMEKNLPPSVPQYRLHRASWTGRFQGLRGVWRDWRPDVVQSHLTGANLLTSVCGRTMGTPVVVTEHGLGLWRTEELKFRAAVRVTYAAASEILCVCEATRRAKMELERAPEVKTRVAYNSFSPTSVGDARLGAKLRVALGIPPEAFVGAFVGRLIDVKRPDLLMQIAGALSGRLAGCHFMVVGDGPWSGALKEWADAPHLRGRVHLLGHRRDVNAVYGASDVLLLPSEREALSLTLLEGAASGLPAVAFDVGGNGEAIADGESGFVVPFLDVGAFAEKILVLGEHREERAEMGRRAAARAQALFSPEARLSALLGTYRMMLE